MPQRQSSSKAMWATICERFKVRYSGCLTSYLNFQQDFPKSRIISLAIGIPKILENIFIRNFRSIQLNFRLVSPQILV